MIEADFAIMHKTRPAHDQAAVTEITGRVRDKIAIVGDDVIMTGGTLLANVEVAEGARRARRLGLRDARPLLRQARSRGSRTPTSPASSSRTPSRSTRSTGPTT